jgi:hypothetical protein
MIKFTFVGIAFAVNSISLHHNTEIRDGQSDAKSGYNVG